MKSSLIALALLFVAQPFQCCRELRGRGGFIYQLVGVVSAESLSQADTLCHAQYPGMSVSAYRFCPR